MQAEAHDALIFLQLENSDGIVPEVDAARPNVFPEDFSPGAVEDVGHAILSPRICACRVEVPWGIFWLSDCIWDTEVDNVEAVALEGPGDVAGGAGADVFDNREGLPSAISCHLLDVKVVGSSGEKIHQINFAPNWPFLLTWVHWESQEAGRWHWCWGSSAEAQQADVVVSWVDLQAYVGESRC